MKFEKTEVWGFEHAIRGMRNNFIYAFYGRKHSEESKKKRMSESAKKRALIETKEQKDRRRCNHSGNRKGVKLTDEQKR